MKLLLSVVVLFLALNEVFAEEMGPNEDQDYWANGYLVQVSGFMREKKKKERKKIYYFGLVRKSHLFITNKSLIMKCCS